MTLEIITVFDSGSILNDDAKVAALNIATSTNPVQATGTRSLARAPDTPSSTR